MKKRFLLTVFAVLICCFGANRVHAAGQYILLTGGFRSLLLSYSSSAYGFNANLPSGWEFLDYNVTTQVGDWAGEVPNLGAQDTDIKVEPLLPLGSGMVNIKYVGAYFANFAPRCYTVEIRTYQQGTPSISLTTTLHVTVEGHTVIPPLPQ